MAMTPSVKYPLTPEQREAIADVVCDNIGDNMQSSYVSGEVFIWTQRAPAVRPTRWVISRDGTVVKHD
jgi:hypothetical protein